MRTLAAAAPQQCSCRPLVVVCSLPITPARTCSEAAAQAKAALRRFREAKAGSSSGSSSGKSGSSSSSSSGSSSGGSGIEAPREGSAAAGQERTGPTRLTVRLPLPSPSRKDDALANWDEGDWPGGILQRFRRLRPLIEEGLLSGYEPQFVGMLESPADGMGVWRAAGGDLTVVTQVGNLNFAPFARLCEGEFGGRVKDPSHTLLVVNPTWTTSKDIGQLWDRQLKASAAELIDDPSAWIPLYYLWDTRTAQGATGVLFRSWPHDWQLYSTCGAEEPGEALDAPPLLVSAQQPAREEQIQLLNAALLEQGPRPWWKR